MCGEELDDYSEDNWIIDLDQQFVLYGRFSQNKLTKAFRSCQFLSSLLDFSSLLWCSDTDDTSSLKWSSLFPLSQFRLLEFHSEGIMKFEAMPLSAKTRYSLKVAKLEIATEIQAAAIPHALAGRCVFNSKDGSRSTLYREMRCQNDQNFLLR